jgi:hypothetical protein
MKTIESAIKAPCLTKSTESFVKGARSFSASIRPVPAQPIPTAKAAPYLM